MKDDRSRNETAISLGVEHLQVALKYAERGRRVFFDEKNPDTRRLVESEPRKAYESINRIGPSVRHANPTLGQSPERVGENRQLLNHVYAELDPDQLWRIVAREARP